MGRVGEAVSLQEKVVAVRTMVFGEGHEDTLMAMGNLVELYWSIGLVEKAHALQVTLQATLMSNMCERLCSSQPFATTVTTLLS
jgi:Tetratricopeptide repeat